MVNVGLGHNKVRVNVREERPCTETRMAHQAQITSARPPWERTSLLCGRLSRSGGKGATPDKTPSVVGLREQQEVGGRNDRRSELTTSKCYRGIFNEIGSALIQDLISQIPEQIAQRKVIS